MDPAWSDDRGLSSRSSSSAWSRPPAAAAQLRPHQRRAATTAPTASAPASAPASAAAATVHVSDRQQGHDRPDEIKAAIEAEGSLIVGNWTYAANAELVKQFQKYVKDTYGEDIKLNYVGTQAPSEYLTKLAAAQQGRQPGAVRRHRRRGELLVRRDRSWPGRQLPAVRAGPEPEARPRRVPARPDLDRLPVDRLPGRRLQQDERALAQVAQGPGRPAPQGQGHPARARATSRPAGSCSASPPSWARTTRTRPR